MLLELGTCGHVSGTGSYEVTGQILLLAWYRYKLVLVECGTWVRHHHLLAQWYRCTWSSTWAGHHLWRGLITPVCLPAGANPLHRLPRIIITVIMSMIIDHRHHDHQDPALDVRFWIAQPWLFTVNRRKSPTKWIRHLTRNFHCCLSLSSINNIWSL